ncbi:MAG: PhzF family phenazine biosynthesis protein [Betaproteobacteria bacterium HGW-Betaproteobacteria-17]|nr:MAG: PhzF family phenazine biosynthesis protein [Betaproteobacteria bacterium HGW-Betaproteobacteria-17]
MTHHLTIVDVFAEHRNGGNPLAVVVCTDPIPGATMQRIATETDYSETTFVTAVPEQNGGYAVRIFTPAREIDFAGHPILGTAWVIRQQLAQDAPGPIRLNLAMGQVAVAFEPTHDGDAIVWFEAPAMTLGATCAPEPMARALGISPHDIDTRWPLQQVSASTAAMIVPLRSLDALRRSRFDLTAYAPLAAQGFPPLVYLFCSEARGRFSDFSARFFFDAHGVREDPATGNGAAFLGAYLLEHGKYVSLSLRIEQGHEMNRPSLVLLRAQAMTGVRAVQVGGRVVPVSQGELL